MKVTLRNALAGIAASLAVFSAVSCSNGELSGPGSSGPDAVSGPAVYEPDGEELPDGGDDNPTEKPVEITLPESVVFHYVYDTTNVILSKAYSSSKDAGITATKNDDGTITVTNNDYVEFKTDKSADGSFTFYDEKEKKYLSIGSDGYLAAVEAVDEYSYWTLTAVEGGYNILNKKADKYFENYNGFTVYTYNSKYPYNYVIDLLDSEKVKYEEAPVVKINLPESVVFHYVYESTNVILSTAYSSSKDAGIAATANEDGSLTVASKDYVTFAPVQNEDDGTFTFYDEAGKKYLSATSKGYLAAVEEADEYSSWNLTVVDGGGYNVKNAKSGKCLEYYGGFTTYAYDNSKSNIFVFDLMDASQVLYKEDTAGQTPDEVEKNVADETIDVASDFVSSFSDLFNDTTSVALDLENTSSWTTSDKLLTLSFGKGEGSSSPALFYYSDKKTGNIRIYAKNTFVFSTENADKKIEKICFTFSSSKYNNLSLNEEQSGSITVDGQTGTWIYADGVDSVSFINASSGQARITKIEVYYKD